MFEWNPYLRVALATVSAGSLLGAAPTSKPSPLSQPISLETEALASASLVVGPVITQNGKPKAAEFRLIEQGLSQDPWWVRLYWANHPDPTKRKKIYGENPGWSEEADLHLVNETLHHLRASGLLRAKSDSKPRGIAEIIAVDVAPWMASELFSMPFESVWKTWTSHQHYAGWPVHDVVAKLQEFLMPFLPLHLSLLRAAYGSDIQLHELQQWVVRVVTQPLAAHLQNSYTADDSRSEMTRTIAGAVRLWNIQQIQRGLSPAVLSVRALLSSRA